MELPLLLEACSLPFLSSATIRTSQSLMVWITVMNAFPPKSVAVENDTVQL